MFHHVDDAAYDRHDPCGAQGHGYQAGQFAVRGSVIDLFPTGSITPLRIDLFDEEIESIRPFDPETQRSEGNVMRLSMFPAREYPCDTPIWIPGPARQPSRRPGATANCL